MKDWTLPHPCESPIEEQLAELLPKYLAESTELGNQVEIPTPHGTFRLDFLLKADGRNVALEADGREFHEYSHDMFRDSIILAYSDIDAIYRLQGRDIYRMLEDAVYVISALEPCFFSERGLISLRNLSTISRRSDRLRTISEIIIGETEDARLAWIQHLSRTMANPIWRRLSDFARANPSASVDQLVLLADAQGLRWYGE